MSDAEPPVVLVEDTDRVRVVTFNRPDSANAFNERLYHAAAGALREAADVAGIASLTSATLESGTTNMDAARIAERLEEQGVRFHTGTSWEVSQVDFTSLVDRSVAAAEIAAELVRAPVFPPDEIERLRQEQLAGIMQRRAEPRGLANEMIARLDQLLVAGIFGPVVHVPLGIVAIVAHVWVVTDKGLPAGDWFGDVREQRAVTGGYMLIDRVKDRVVGHEEGAIGITHFHADTFPDFARDGALGEVGI